MQGTYYQDPQTGETYYVDPQTGRGTKTSKKRGSTASSGKSITESIGENVGDGLIFLMMCALGIALLFAWGMNVDPVITYFDTPLIERIGKFFLLKGFFSHIAIIWIWRIFGCIGWVWVVLTLRRSSFLFWLGAVLAGIVVLVGPNIFQDSSPLVFGLAIWFCIQTFELLPVIKGKRSTAMDETARGLAYLAEFYFQFWMYPPYGSGDIRDMIADISRSGQIDWMQVNWEMIVLSLIAIFSFEGVYLIFDSLRGQIWK